MRTHAIALGLLAGTAPGLLAGIAMAAPALGAPALGRAGPGRTGPDRVRHRPRKP